MHMYVKCVRSYTLHYMRKLTFFLVCLTSKEIFFCYYYTMFVLQNSILFGFMHVFLNQCYTDVGPHTWPIMTHYSSHLFISCILSPPLLFFLLYFYFIFLLFSAHGLNGHVISDGGCTCPGDFSKAFGM